MCRMKILKEFCAGAIIAMLVILGGLPALVYAGDDPDPYACEPLYITEDLDAGEDVPGDDSDGIVNDAAESEAGCEPQDELQDEPRDEPEDTQGTGEIDDIEIGTDIDRDTDTDTTENEEPGAYNDTYPSEYEGIMATSGSADNDDDEGQEKDETAAAEGSVSVIIGGEELVFLNTVEMNAIQRAVNEIIENAIETGTGQDVVIDINVSDGIFLDDINIVASDALSDAISNLRINIVADNDAGAHVLGNIFIDGIDVLLSGIYLSMKNRVSVKNAEFFAYHGTALSDRAEFILYNVQNIELNGSSGSDHFTISIARGSEADINLGDGHNRLDLTVINATTDESDPDLSRLSANVSTGAGANTINIGGRSEDTWERLARSGESSVIGIGLGDGDNLVNIDTSLAFSSHYGVVVDVAGGGGFDRIHFTGNLRPESYDSTNPNIMGDELNLTLYAANSTGLNITTSDINAFTDALEGKMTFVGEIDGNTQFQEFRNYVLKDPTSSFTNSTGAGGLLLTNLVVHGTNLTVGDISVPGVNIRIVAEHERDSDNILENLLRPPVEVNVQGELRGQNIIIEARSIDNSYSHMFNLSVVDEGGESVGFTYLGARTEARVTIGEDAVLDAAGGAVSLMAESLQRSAIIPTKDELNRRFDGLFANGADDINFLLMRTGIANVDIRGQINAESIRAKAYNNISLSMTPDCMKDCTTPLAISILSGSAEVNVSGNAKLQATGSGIFLKAESVLSLENISRSGDFPFAAAVTVANNDVRLNMDGNLNAEDGNVVLLTRGDTRVINRATEGGGEDTAPGGIFGVTVADQDVRLTVNGIINARNAHFTSYAFMSVLNEAVVTPGERNGGGDKNNATIQGVLDSLRAYFAPLSDGNFLINGQEPLNFLIGLIEKLIVEIAGGAVDEILEDLIDSIFESFEERLNEFIGERFGDLFEYRIGAIIADVFDMWFEGLIDELSEGLIDEILEVLLKRELEERLPEHINARREIFYQEMRNAGDFDDLSDEEIRELLDERVKEEMDGIIEELTEEITEELTELLENNLSDHLQYLSDETLEELHEETARRIREGFTYDLTREIRGYLQNQFHEMIIEEAAKELRETLTRDMDGLSALGPAMNRLDGVGEGNEGAGAADVVDSGTAGAAENGEKASGTQVLGSFAVTYANNSNSVTINGDKVNVSGGLTAASTGATSVRTVANATMSDDADDNGNNNDRSDNGDNAIGTAVAVGVIRHTNEVKVNGAEAGNINLIATTPLLFGQTASKAAQAADAGEFGLAGAISVQVLGGGNNAVLNGPITINGGDISVNSRVMQSGMLVTADALGKGAGGTGIGAGISVSVGGIDVDAVLGGQIQVNNSADSQMGDLNVSAAHNGFENVSAVAGAAAGTAIVPALNVVVSGVGVNAEILTGNDINLGNAIVNAANNIQRNIRTGAMATGVATGVAGGLNVVVVNDSAKALLSRNMHARYNVDVSARSSSGAAIVSRAGTEGGGSDSGGGGSDPADPDPDPAEQEPPEGSADEAADAAIAGGASLAGIVNSGNVNTDQVESSAAGRQKAETTEDEVGVAAAFALNIQRNASLAEISGNVTAGGDIDVTSVNNTNATVTANASAVRTSAGVGVAVAINLVEYGNRAIISGDVHAGGRLNLRAYQGGDDNPNSFTTHTIAGAGATNVGVAGSVAIARIIGNTEAFIRNNITAEAGGDASVRAEAGRDVETVASTDVNRETGGADKGESTKPENEDEPRDADADKTRTDEDGNITVGVGAAFAMSITTMNVNAGIGDNGSLRAAALEIIAEAVHNAGTASVSGTCPFGGAQSGAFDVGIDASAAVNLLTNRITAQVGRGTAVTTTTGDLTIHADQEGKTTANASGFAMGDQTAVGAAVAFTMASSDVQALFRGQGNISGEASIRAEAVNVDDVNAVALAMGADAQRFIDRFTDAELRVPQNLGSGNNTSSEVTDALRPESEADGEPVDNSLPLSTNALRALNVTTVDTNPDSNDLSSHPSDVNGNLPEDTNSPSTPEGEDSQNVQIAAAVAVNLAAHRALAEITGSLTTAGAVLAEAINNSNLSAAAIGAAFAGSGDNNNAIGAAASGVRTRNETKVVLGGTIRTTGGDLTGEATLRQNMDQPHSGRYMALAVGGSHGPGGGAVGGAGSVAVIVSRSEASVNVQDCTTIDTTNGANGRGDVNLTATGQAKVNAGAMAFTNVGDSTFGMGASFGMIRSNNTIEVAIGNRVTITARDLNLNAYNMGVSMDDWELPFDMDELFGEGGIVNIVRDEDGQEDSITFKIDDTNDLFNLAQLTSAMGNVNYFILAIAGVLAGDDATFSLNATGVLLLLQGLTRAGIGNNVNLNLTGDLEIQSKNITNARTISGGFSYSDAKVGLGINAAFIRNFHSVVAEIGADGNITVSVSVSVIADNKVDMLAMGAVAGGGLQGDVGVGAAFAIIITNNEVRAEISGGTRINAGGDVKVSAANDADLTAITVTLMLALDGVSVGAIFTWIDTTTSVIARVDQGAYIITNGGIDITADNTENLIIISAAASVGENSGAGTINVIRTDSETIAEVGNNARLEAEDDINITAEANAGLTTIQAAAAIGAGGKASVGGAFSFNFFDREVRASVGENVTIRSNNGSIDIHARATDRSFILTVAGAVTTGTAAVSGNVQFTMASNDIRASVDTGSSLFAGNDISIIAELDSTLYSIAPTLAAAGKVSVGITAVVILLENTVQALVNGATLTAGAETPRADRRRGIHIGASIDENILLAAFAGGGAGTTGVYGVFAVLINENVVRASTHNARMTAGSTREGETAPLPSNGTGDIRVEAEAENEIQYFAGALSVAGKAGIGITMAALVLEREVTASIQGGGAWAAGNVIVSAKMSDNVIFVGATIAGGGVAGVGVGGNVLYFISDVLAELGGTINSGGDVDVTAESNSDLDSVAVTVGAGGKAGVSVAAAVTYFMGGTTARILPGARINYTPGSNNIRGGNINIQADSTQTIDAIAASLGVGGAAGIGTAAVVVITGVTTEAYTGSDVRMRGSSLNVSASDDYNLLGIAAGAGGGVAGVGITAIVTIASNTIRAGIGNNNNIIVSGSIGITAEADRVFRMYAGAVGIGGAAGVGATVMVAVIGSRLDADSYRAMSTGFGSISDDGNEAEDGSIHDWERNVRNQFPSLRNRGAGRELPTLNRHMDLDPELDPGGIRVECGCVGDCDDDCVLNSGFGYVHNDTRNAHNDQGDNDDRSPGAGHTPDDSDYLDDAGNIVLRPSEVPEYVQDTVRAFVGNSSSVESTEGNITMSARDTVNADLIAAALGVGGKAGVGIGIAVLILHSNVIAEVAASGADNRNGLHAGGTVTVRAESGFGGRPECNLVVYINGEPERRQFADFDIGDDETNTVRSNGTLRVIAASAGAGLVGVSVPVAVALISSNVRASVEGNVTAGALNVEAILDFPMVLAAALGIGGGLVGVTASVAVAQFSGNVVSAIRGNANIHTPGGAVEVTSDSSMNATVVAPVISVGGVAVGVAVAVALNRANVQTYVGQGVSMTTGSLTVSADVNTSAEAYILAAAVGGVVVGVPVAIANVRPTVLTFIGANPDPGITADNPTAGQLIRVTGNLIVENNIVSESLGSIISLAAGGVAAAINVLLVYNTTVARAAINRANVEAGSIRVDANMSALNRGFVASVSAGKFALGVVVIVSRLDADNRALIDVTNTRVTSDGTIDVHAGRSGNVNSFIADARGVAVGVGLVAANVNVTIADNYAVNRATVQGNASGSLTAGGALSVGAESNSTATASIHGLTAGAGTIAVSVINAVLRTRQYAEITGGNITAGGLDVVAGLSRNELYSSDARLLAGVGGLVGIGVNVVTAHSQARNTAQVTPSLLNITGGNVNVESIGLAGARTRISNVTVGIASIGVMVGLAYAESTFIALLNLPAGSVVTANNVTVRAIYTSRAIANVTPASGGVLVVGVNRAVAESNATGQAQITGSGGIDAAGDVIVSVTGTVQVDAVINSFTPVSVANVTVSIVRAIANGNQLAHLDGTVSAGRDVTVGSTLNAAASAAANAAPVAVSVVGVGSNRAFALAGNIISETIIGVGAVINSGRNIIIESILSFTGAAKIGAAMFSASLAGVEVNRANAIAGNITSQVTVNSGAAINADGNVNIISRANTTLSAVNIASSINLDGVGVATTHLTAEFTRVTVQTLINAGAAISGAAVTISADTTLTGTATKQSPTVDISLVGVATIYVNATARDVVSRATIGSNAEINARGAANITSRANIILNATNTTGVRDSTNVGLVDVVAINAVVNFINILVETFVRNSASVRGSSVNIRADGILTGTAHISPASGFSLGGVGNTNANATVGTGANNGLNVRAIVEQNTALESTAGDVNVIANAATTLRADMDTTVTAGLFVNVSNIILSATVHRSRAEAQMNASAVSASAVNINALNNITINTRVHTSGGGLVSTGGTNLSGTVNGQFSIVTIGPNADILARAANGTAVNITADANTVIISGTSLTGGGVVRVGSATVRGELREQSATVDIQGGARILAPNIGANIIINAITQSNIKSRATMGGGGFAAFGSAHTHAILNDRTTTVTIGGNADIEASLGNITILSDARPAELYANSRVTGGGFAAGSDPTAVARLNNSNTRVTILGAGAGQDGIRILAPHGTLRIEAHSNSNISAIVFARASGAGAFGSGRATAENNNENINIVIAQNSAVQGYINSHTTIVRSQLGQNVFADAQVFANGAGFTTNAIATANGRSNDLTVDIHNVLLGGLGSLTVEAVVLPPNNDRRIRAEAFASANGLGGSVRATANSILHNRASVTAHSDSILAGTNINVRADAQIVPGQIMSWNTTAISRSVSGFFRRIFRGESGVTNNNAGNIPENRNSVATVELHGDVRLGGGSAGAYITVDEDGNVNASGVNFDRSRLLENAGARTLHGISFGGGAMGSLTITLNANNQFLRGNPDVHGNHILPYIRITNRSLLDLYIDGFSATNTDGRDGTVTIRRSFSGAFNSSTFGYNRNRVTASELTIINYNEGVSIVFFDAVEFGMGRVYIHAGRGNIRTEGAGALWASHLSIRNAGEIGGIDNDGNLNRMVIYLTNLGGENGGEIFLNALNDIFAEITLVVVDGIRASEAKLRLREVVAGNTVDLLIHAPITMTSTELGTPAPRPDFMPNAPKTVVDTVRINLSGAGEFDIRDFQVDSFDGRSYHRLPSGVIVITNVSGAIIGIMMASNGRFFNVEEDKSQEDGLIVLNNGNPANQAILPNESSTRVFHQDGTFVYGASAVSHSGNSGNLYILNQNARTDEVETSYPAPNGDLVRREYQHYLGHVVQQNSDGTLSAFQWHRATSVEIWTRTAIRDNDNNIIGHGPWELTQPRQAVTPAPPNFDQAGALTPANFSASRVTADHAVTVVGSGLFAQHHRVEIDLMYDPEDDPVQIYRFILVGPNGTHGLCPEWDGDPFLEDPALVDGAIMLRIGPSGVMVLEHKDIDIRTEATQNSLALSGISFVDMGEGRRMVINPGADGAGGAPRGTIQYLSGNTVIAESRPDGSFRIIGGGTFAPGASGAINATFPAGTSVSAVRVSDGLYKAPGTGYFDGQYRVLNDRGDPVIPVTDITQGGNHPVFGSIDRRMSIARPGEEPFKWIIEQGSRTIFYFPDDGSWIDNNGDTNESGDDTNRLYYVGDFEILLTEASARDVSISILGRSDQNTSLLGDGNARTIRADDLTITTGQNVTLGSEGNRLDIEAHTQPDPALDPDGGRGTVNLALPGQTNNTFNNQGFIGIHNSNLRMNALMVGAEADLDINVLQGDASFGTVGVSGVFDLDIMGDLDVHTANVYDGGRLDIYAEGDAVFENVNVAGGGEFDLKTVGSLDINTRADIDGTFNASAGGDVTFDNLTTNGLVDLYAGGSLEIETTTIGTGGVAEILAHGSARLELLNVMTGGRLELDVLQNLFIYTANIRGAAVIGVALNAELVNFNVLNGGTANFAAGGDVWLDDVDVEAGGEFDINAEGSAYLGRLDIRGRFGLGAGEDVEFDQIVVSGRLDIAAGGDITMKYANSLFVLNPGAGSRSSLSAGGNIGAPDKYLRVSVPDGEPLRILDVLNLYVLQKTVPRERDDFMQNESGNQYGSRGEHGYVYGTIIGYTYDTLPDQIVELFENYSFEDFARQLINALNDERIAEITADALFSMIDGTISGADIADILDALGFMEAHLNIEEELYNLREYLAGRIGAIDDEDELLETLLQGLGIVGDDHGYTLDELVDLYTQLRLDSHYNEIMGAALGLDELIEILAYLEFIDDEDSLDSLEDEILTGLLVAFMESRHYTEGHNALLLSRIIESLSPEQRAELIEMIYGGIDWPNPNDHINYETRELLIEITRIRGDAYVENDGDVTINVETGDISVGRAGSLWGDVDITARSGSILAGEAIDGSHEVYDSHFSPMAHIFGTNVNLWAYGSVGASGQALVIEHIYRDPTIVGTIIGELEEQDWILEHCNEAGGFILRVNTDIDFTTVLPIDLYALGGLTVTAETGSVFLKNETGDFSISNITALDTVFLATENNLTGNGVVTARNIELHAGRDIGSYENPLAVYHNHINGPGALTAAGDNIYLSNQSGRLVIDSVSANNEAVISSNGTITDNRADYVSERIEVEKEVVRQQSRYELTEEQIRILDEYLAAMREELGLDSAEEAADQADVLFNEALTGTDGISDINEAMQELDNIADERDRLESEVAYILERILEAGSEYGGLPGLIDEMGGLLDRILVLDNRADDLELLLTLHGSAVEANNHRNAIISEIENSRAYTLRSELEDLAAEIYIRLQNALENRNEAENAVNSSDAAIKTGGDLTLTADRIGDADNALSIDVGGTLHLNITAGLNIESAGDIVIGNTINVTSDARISAIDSISLPEAGEEGGAVITADSAWLNTLNGTIGTEGDPLVLNVNNLSAMGTAVNIINNGSLNIGTIISQSVVNIEANGNITADNVTPYSNIYAGNINLKADGDIGTPDNSLSVSTDYYSSESGNLYLHSNSPTLTIGDTTANGHAGITADGNVQGGVLTAGSLDMEVFGNIGGSDEGRRGTFLYYVPGDVRVESLFGINRSHRNLHDPHPRLPGITDPPIVTDPPEITDPPSIIRHHEYFAGLNSLCALLGGLWFVGRDGFTPAWADFSHRLPGNIEADIIWSMPDVNPFGLGCLRHWFYGNLNLHRSSSS